MKHTLTKEHISVIEEILNNGSRAEILIEQNKIVIVEIKRKIRLKNNKHNS